MLRTIFRVFPALAIFFTLVVISVATVSAQQQTVCNENRTPYGFCLPSPSQDGWNIQCGSYTNRHQVCHGVNRYGTRLYLFVGNAAGLSELTSMAVALQRNYLVDGDGQRISVSSYDEQQGRATVGGMSFQWLRRHLVLSRDSDRERRFILFRTELPGGRLLYGDLRQTGPSRRDMNQELFTVMRGIQRIPVAVSSN